MAIYSLLDVKGPVKTLADIAGHSVRVLYLLLVVTACGSVCGPPLVTRILWDAA